MVLPGISAAVQNALIGALIGLACLILLLVVAGIIARYVAETALMRMVADHEDTGEKRGVGHGFRLGWSRTAFRLFLIDLVVVLPLVLAFILLFAIALAPLLLWLTEETTVGVVGTVATIGLSVLVILLAIVVALAVSLLMVFFRRACALESLGAIEAIKRGYGLVRRHFKDAAIMWLLMVGIGLGWGLIMIPLVFTLLVLGVLLGALPGLLAGGLASLFAEGAIPWITGAVIAAPIFLLVVTVPSVFLAGLMEVFKSSVWTLTYRELLTLEPVWVEAEPLPDEGSGWEPAEME